MSYKIVLVEESPAVRWRFLKMLEGMQGLSKTWRIFMIKRSICKVIRTVTLILLVALLSEESCVSRYVQKKVIPSNGQRDFWELLRFLQILARKNLSMQQLWRLLAVLHEVPPIASCLAGIANTPQGLTRTPPLEVASCCYVIYCQITILHVQKLNM